MSATIFSNSGTEVKTLKQILSLNDEVKILSGTVDPTSSAVDAPKGSLYLNTSNGNIYKKQDAGSSTNWVRMSTGGEAGINYIDNSDAEQNTTGWATYADAAGTSPVDGTGGSATVTITRTTSSPLRDTGSFLITKDAADRQGQGVSYPFTIDSADKAKVLAIEFDYNIESGTFASGDSSDIRMWIYDVTNSVLIQPTPYTIQGGGSSNHRFKSMFQSNSNSTSYRIIFHVATTSASAWTFKFDNVYVGPDTTKALLGAPISDWKTFTPTGSNITFSNNLSVYRRVGDSLEVNYSIAVTAVSGNIVLNLPSGYTIDTSKIASGANASVGMATTDDGSGEWIGSLLPTSTTALAIYGPKGENIWNATTPFAWAGTLNLRLHVVVPIVGWSSTVEMSHDVDNRVCGATLYASAVQSIPDSTNTKIEFDTVEYDSHSAFSTANDRYVCQIGGVYDVVGCVSYNGGASGIREAHIYINGVQKCRAQFLTNGGGYGTTAIASKSFKLNAGDYIEIFSYQDNGGALNTINGIEWTYLSVNRRSGPAVVAASEAVNARYTHTAGQSIPDNTYTIIDYETRDYSSHGNVTTGAAWKFTCQVAGKYRISARALFVNGGGWAANETAQLFIYKNGSEASVLQATYMQAVYNYFVHLVGSDTLSLQVGDYIDIRVLQNSGGALALNNSGSYSNVAIEKVG